METAISEIQSETEQTLPEGWKIKRLGALVKFINGYAFKPEDWKTEGLPIIRIQNLNDNGAIYNYYNGQVEERYYVNKGDLLFAWSGTKGVSFGARIWKGNLAILNQHIFRVVPTSVDSAYCYFLLRGAQEAIEKNAHGFKSSFVHVTKRDLEKVSVALPPLAEQHRITAILTKWDEGIEKLQTLIEKKKLRKQALMQRLLTGQSRFSEFARQPWETVRLGEVCSLNYGKEQKNVADPTGDFDIIGTGGVVGKAVRYIHDRPSVILGRKGTIDKPYYAEQPFWAIDTTFYVEARDEVLMRWLFYWFTNAKLKDYNEASGVPSLSRETLYKIPLNLPSLDEQRRIAAVLSAADLEIEGLTQELTLMKRQKSGLMQGLLTGQISVKELTEYE